MNGLVARPTTYRGIPMRSRLEARFAAELDETGENWAYEPRAYGNQYGQYLPDFEVVRPTESRGEVHLFVEVRPTLAGAYRAMEQMPIILDSEPDAILLITIPDLGLWWLRSRSRSTWRLTA